MNMLFYLGMFAGGPEPCVWTNQPAGNGNRQDRRRDAGDQVLRAIRSRTPDLRRRRQGDAGSHRSHLASRCKRSHRISYRQGFKHRRLAVPKGDYTLYVNVKDPDAWELVINKQTGQWGTKYDQSQDLGRVKMDMKTPPAPVEVLKYTITSTGGNKGLIQLAWEKHMASVGVTAVTK